MLDQLHRTLRVSLKNGFIAPASRLFVLFGLLLVLPVGTYAYTVVMVGGHQVEIPDTFIVTLTTLTYEASPGINVTLQMSMIDIDATERANQEPSGSLFRRVPNVYDQQPSSTEESPSPRARRTVTNRDLEKMRRTRLASEAAYERRRREQGWPSRAESERLRQQEAARAREILSAFEGEKAEAESYWRARATALRNEAYTLDAEINYVRASLALLPESSGPTIYGVGSPDIFSTPYPTGRPDVDYERYPGGRKSRAGLPGSIGTYGGGRDERPCRYYPCVPEVVVMTPEVDYSTYDRVGLMSRLRELEASRAGLQARWRLLEDEARRAGAQPGWLRP
jgi:hypothetical protein